MKLIYDEEVDAAYLEFYKADEVITQRLTEDIAVNYSGGKISGIEILSAKEYLFKNSEYKKIILENLEPVTHK